DDPLRLRDARALRVRRVAEQEVDAAVAELGELADVGPLPVDGRVVELVVTGVHDAPAGRLEHDGGSIGDRVRHADELDAERTEVEGLVAARTGTCTSRMRYGSEPTWSSCPCVRTTPRIISARSMRYEKSGSTRSTPRCSSRGNARPASTTTIEPSASYTVMFFPTSPRPPRGMIRQRPNATPGPARERRPARGRRAPARARRRSGRPSADGSRRARARGGSSRP